VVNKYCFVPSHAAWDIPLHKKNRYTRDITHDSHQTSRLNLPPEFIDGDGHRHHARRSAIIPGHLARPVLHISIVLDSGKNFKKVALTYHTGGTSLAKL
jgi:hypothetical protein